MVSISLLYSTFIALINIFTSHALLTRKRSIKFCGITFVLNTLLVLFVAFMVQMIFQDQAIKKYALYLAAFLYVIYVILVFKESTVKKIFTMFSIWMLSTICLVIANLAAQLSLGIGDADYVQNFVYIFRIALQVLCLLAAYWGVRKPYKNIINIVSDKTLGFMALYPVIAFLLMADYMVAVEMSKNLGTVCMMVLFIVFVIMGYVMVFAAIASVSQIIALQYNMEKLTWASNTDLLTGLYNRRFYETELKRLDNRRNLPLSIAMGDVNGLKLINDSLGHAMGDELLKKIAEVIKQACRADDIIARIGGDEFVIILPKTDAFQTWRITRRIQELVGKEKVGNSNLSISFGYETKNSLEENIGEVLKKAEDKMYKQKLLESPGRRDRAVEYAPRLATVDSPGTQP